LLATTIDKTRNFNGWAEVKIWSSR
jgi:hypothetical protein